MVVRRKHWPLLIALFVLGPIAGAVFGAFCGAPLVEGFFGCEQAQQEPATTAPSPTATFERPESTEPRVQLPNGEHVELAELAPGRKVAVVVMKGPWCPVCQRQLRAVSDRLHEVQDAGGAVFGLSTGDVHTNQRLVRKLGLDFPIVSDPDYRVLEKLGMWLPRREYAMPGVIFLDEHGQIESIHRGRYPGKPQGDFILDRLR